MKIREKNNKNVLKFQEGGAMPADAGAGAQSQGQDPLMALAQMAMQAVQSQDCNAAMQVCEGFVQMVQQASGGQEQQGQPVYQKGGKLVKRMK